MLADTYPPNKTSGAVLLSDLAEELSNRGIHVLVVVPCESDVSQELAVISENLSVLRVPSTDLKGANYVRRTLGELMLSRRMKKGLLVTGLTLNEWNGVVWYSPTIFLGQFASEIVSASKCPGYLILRDIFPEWAVDMGVMSRGLIYRFFKHFERKQYTAATYIGVQSQSALEYFERDFHPLVSKVEVLNNWLGPSSFSDIPSELSYLERHNGKIVVYTGNIGVAQGMDVFVDAFEKLSFDPSLLFVFIGRGSGMNRLKEMAAKKNLSSVHFHNEIDPGAVNSVLKFCDVGIVSLDIKHRTTNIPGKFLGYLRAGLTVVAKINPGNELVELINSSRIGIAITEDNGDLLKESILKLTMSDDFGAKARRSALKLFDSKFQVHAAANQILEKISKNTV